MASRIQGGAAFGVRLLALVSLLAMVAVQLAGSARAERPSVVSAGNQEPAGAAPNDLLNAHDAFWLSQRDAGGQNEAGDAFGESVASGDFNGDGLMDVAIGAPTEAPASDPQSGAVFVLQGSGGGPTLGKYRWISQTDGGGANEAGDQFGRALTVGDFNGDGYADLAVGAPYEAPGSDPDSGAVFVFPGSPTGLATGTFFTQRDADGSNESGDLFGYALAAGDFDDDGYDDLAVGAPNEAPVSDPNSGAIFILPGSSTGLTQGRYYTQTDGGGSNEAGDRFGAALVAGNFNNDAYADLAIGAPGEAPGGDPKSGAVFVFRGAGSGLTGGTFYTQRDANGTNEDGDEFGYALASGRFNGDSYDDLAIGAPGEAPGSDPASGVVFLLFGTAGGFTDGNFFTQTVAGGANEDGDAFGYSLAAGNFNGDGYDDLAIGAPGEAPSGDPRSGVIFVVPGSSSGIRAGTFFTQVDGGGANEAGDEFGDSLAAGDVNGDGADDLIVGVPSEAPASDPASGAAFYFPGYPTAPVVTHGGLVGAVTDTTAKIWARSDYAALLKVQFRESGIGQWLTTEAVSLTSAHDFTGVVNLTGLMPGTTYDYRLVLTDAVQLATQATFRTLPPANEPGTFTFALGADTLFGADPYTIFDRIDARDPDFMLLVGDQVYADSPYLIEDSLAAYRRKYKENWAEDHMRGFMQQHPIFMMWDDHEIRNDWDEGQSGRYANAQAAFDEYQRQHGPAPRPAGDNYYAFRVGEADFYVLDTRSFRSPENVPDNASKTMLGSTQKADLKNWLLASDAKFKFIVSSVFWNDFGTTGNDSWHGYQTERNEIFQYVRDNEIRGVVLLSGDQHWTGVFRLEEVAPYHLYEFSPTPLGVGNRTATGSNDPQILFKYDDGRVYGFFEVDTTVTPARLRFDVYDSSNTSIYHLEITEDDISPAVAGVNIYLPLVRRSQ